MADEPLLSYFSPRRSQPPPQSLCPLPEDNEISLPIPLTVSPSELKERLIFGPSSPCSREPSPKFADALNQPLKSATCSSDITATPESQSHQSWLTDPNYSWRKSNLHRSKTAPAMAAINAVENPSVANPNM